MLPKTKKTGATSWLGGRPPFALQLVGAIALACVLIYGVEEVLHEAAIHGAGSLLERVVAIPAEAVYLTQHILEGIRNEG